MDSQIGSAGRALAAGDPLGALKRVALRRDPVGLALRGIAMAQLGELRRAQELLRRAVRGLGANQGLARARCVTAQAEIALAARDLRWPMRPLLSALATLDARGDRVNATYARLVLARRLLVLGRVDEAEHALSRLDLRGAPPMLAAAGELAKADAALRRYRARSARAALERAWQAARSARIPALVAQAENALAELEKPAAHLIARGTERPLRLEDVEAVVKSQLLVVDAGRRVVMRRQHAVSLAARPVLFELARALAEASPADVPRNTLITRVFGASRPNESHRARLRVQIGRLRRKLDGLLTIRATRSGYLLEARGASAVAVLVPPIEGGDGALIALLADGECWSTSALALATSSSQRTVQRALTLLAAAGKVESLGRARARRWIARPIPGFSTMMLLAAPLASGADQRGVP